VHSNIRKCTFLIMPVFVGNCGDPLRASARAKEQATVGERRHRGYRSPDAIAGGNSINFGTSSYQ